MSFNRDWHLSNPFPREKGEDEKNVWRAAHAKNCTCGVRKKK